MWEENREIVKAILVDIVLWSLALGALFIAYLVLHQMEKAGYPHDKSAQLEEIHYFAYLGVQVLFASDLLVKLFIFLFFRKKVKRV
jgi:hypothetical protein